MVGMDDRLKPTWKFLLPLLDLDEDEIDFVEWDSLDGCLCKLSVPEPVLIGSVVNFRICIPSDR